MEKQTDWPVVISEKNEKQTNWEWNSDKHNIIMGQFEKQTEKNRQMEKKRQTGWHRLKNS